MMRWILLLVGLGLLYWTYQRGDWDSIGKPGPVAERPTPGPTLEPGGRLGGGLNPFVSDGDPGGGVGRPPMPKIPR